MQIEFLSLFSSSRKDRKSAPLRILSTLCVFNRNRHWDESRWRWNWDEKKRNTSEIEKHSSVANKKGKKEKFLKKDTIKCDIQERRRRNIPFHNVSRQKIIGCLRNEFNWKLKSNKSYNGIDDMDLLNCLPNRNEIDFKRFKMKSTIRKVFFNL